MKNALMAVAITALMGGLVIAPVTQQSAEAQVYSGLKSTSAPADSELLTLVGHGAVATAVAVTWAAVIWAAIIGQAAAIRTLLMEAEETGTAITEIRMATTIIGKATPTTGPTTTTITAITGTAATTPIGTEGPTPTVTAIARGSAVRR
jgi:hypothetical protein